MPDFLVDCNHMSAALRKVSAVRDRIHQGRRTGHRFVVCYPVLCELEVGIQQTQKVAENRRVLHKLLQHMRIWPLDGETTRQFGAIYIELRRKGRVLSQVDMMLAALARQHALIVLTTDQDFEALNDVAVENWVS